MKTFLIFLFSTLCTSCVATKNNDIFVYVSSDEYMNNSIWVFDSSGEKSNKRIKTILYFCDGFYVEIRQGMRFDNDGKLLVPTVHIFPKSKIACSYLRKEDGLIFIKRHLEPGYPDFRVDTEKEILTEEWPAKKDKTTYTKITSAECDKLLENFKIGDVNFANLPIRNK